jgi:hypothetical protein
MLKNKEEVNMTKLNTISVRSHIVLADIADILYSADVGTNYWNSHHSNLGYEKNVVQMLEDDDKGIIIADVEDCDENDVPKSYILNKKKLKKGLTVLAKKYPHHFCDILKKETDMITADVLVQCSIFGDILYS